jgi:hypothetical protein
VTDVCFSRPKVGLGLIGSAGLFWLGVWMVTIGGLKATLFGGILVLGFAYMLVYFARYLLDNRILSVGATGIEHHGMVSTRRLRLDQIANIMVETQTVNGNTTRTLVIVPHEGHGGSVKFAERWLEGRFGGCEGVANLIANGPAVPPQPARRLPIAPDTPAAVPGAPPQPGQARTFGRKAV